MALVISLIDICLPDFLSDHHNRDGELLLGICLAGQSPDEAAQMLLDELNWGRYPQGVDDKAFLALAKDASQGVDFCPCDGNGNPVSKDSEAFQAAMEGNEAQAWFLLEWEK